MPSAATRAVIALCFLLVAWYFVGLWWNRRLARRALRWLRDAWRTAGRGQVRWLSWGHVQVTWDPGPEPFARLGAAVVLLPREGLLAWPGQLARGRTDLLVLRGRLRRPPERDADLQPGGVIRRLELRRGADADLACEIHLGRALCRPAGEVMRAVIDSLPE